MAGFIHSVLSLVCILFLPIVLSVPFRGYTYYREVQTPRTGLDTSGRELKLNGAPLRILSGTIHYFRVPHQHWNHRLRQLKANGLNTVETYVPWNLHEPLPGQFVTDGDLNIAAFIEEAIKLDLFVILRPGPYICAEWDFGGLPSWLLSDPRMRVRTSDAAYMDHVKLFIENLFNVVQKYQFQKDGPIITVQVENEYGAYGDSFEFMTAMANILKQNGSVIETLVTSDQKPDLVAGKAPDAWMTVNGKENMADALEGLQKAQPNRPMMVMEYWSGWFDHWMDSAHNGVPVEKFASELNSIFERNASVNFYVYHGGTNFGFLNGANRDTKNENYQPDVTSYDYDALVTEAGVLTEKWNRTRAMLSTYNLLSDNLDPPPANPVFGNYGALNVSDWLAFDHIKEAMDIKQSLNGEVLVPMEALEIKVNPLDDTAYGQSFGFLSYETFLENKHGQLVIEEMHDRAIVFIDGKQISIIEFADSTKRNHTIDIKKSEENAARVQLTIFVENLGRANYANKPQPMDDQRKGLIGSVWFAGAALNGWTAFPFEFTNADLLGIGSSTKWNTNYTSHKIPAVFRFNFNVDDDFPKDTFLNVTDWGHGIALVNGHNIGRFWPSAGPQQTLYVPGPWLKKGANTLLIFEVHQSRRHVVLQDTHVLHKVTAGAGMMKVGSFCLFSLLSVAGIFQRFFM